MNDNGTISEEEFIDYVLRAKPEDNLLVVNLVSVASSIVFSLFSVWLGVLTNELVVKSYSPCASAMSCRAGQSTPTTCPQV